MQNLIRQLRCRCPVCLKHQDCWNSMEFLMPILSADDWLFFQAHFHRFPQAAHRTPLPGQRRPGQVPRSALGLARLGTGWGGVDPRFADLGEAWGFQKDILGKTDLAGNVDVEWCRFTSKLSFSFFFILEIFGIPNGTVWWEDHTLCIYTVYVMFYI